jgi:hypothetical protein
MGNSLSQRVINQNCSDVFEFWKQEYFQQTGSNIMLSNKLPEIMYEGLKDTCNLDVKQKVFSQLTKEVSHHLPSMSDRKDYSQIMKDLQAMRSQMSPEHHKEFILKGSYEGTTQSEMDIDSALEQAQTMVKTEGHQHVNYPNPLESLRTQDLIMHTCNSYANSLLAKEKFELSLILYTMSKNIGANMKGLFEPTPEAKNIENQLIKIAERFNKKSSETLSMDVMITTFKIFVENFQNAIRSGDFKNIVRIMDQAFDLIGLIETEKDLNREGCDQDYKSDECFKNLTVAIISLIKMGKVTDSQSQTEIEFTTP